MIRAASKASLIQNAEERKSGHGGKKGRGWKEAKKGKQKNCYKIKGI